MPKILYKVATKEEAKGADPSRLAIARHSAPGKHNAGDLILSFSGKSYKEIYKLAGGEYIAFFGRDGDFHLGTDSRRAVHPKFKQASAEGCYREGCKDLGLFEV